MGNVRQNIWSYINNDYVRKKIMHKRNSEHFDVKSPPQKKHLLQLPPGEIVTDLTNRQWRLGKAIGSGAFGDVYLVSDNIKTPVRNDTPYVMKIENHTNGPLFVEVNCLLRIAREQMINEFNDKHKIESLGVPAYVASGSHTFRDEKIRFLILPKYDQDLEQIFVSKQKKFNSKTVILICTEILDILKYIHSHGYVHCDIKASNLMYSLRKCSTSITSDLNGVLKSKSTVRNLRVKPLVNYNETSYLDFIFSSIYTDETRKKLRPKQNINYDETIFEEEEEEYYSTSKIVSVTKEEIVLIDYGLATKYRHSDGRHKQYCNDERKAHAGTMLFCSLDAHLGAMSRRSDLESLGYNMVYWLTSTLPWCDDVSNPEIVQSKKQNCFNNLNMFLYKCPGFVHEYFQYIKTLNFESEPDYDYCKQLLLTALKQHGYKLDGCFDFDNLESSNLEVLHEKLEHRAKSPRKPLTVSNVIHDKPRLRKTIGFKKQSNKKKKTKKKATLYWSNNLLDPEEILRHSKKLSDSVRKTRERKLTENSDSSGNGLQNLDIWILNPTAAMLEVYYKSIGDKNANYNNGHKGTAKGDGLFLEQREGYTHAMNLVLTALCQRRLTETVPPLHRTRSVTNANEKKIQVNNKRTKSAINTITTRIKKRKQHKPTRRI